jgi:hypothetical protein
VGKINFASIPTPGGGCRLLGVFYPDFNALSEAKTILFAIETFHAFLSTPGIST